MEKNSWLFRRRINEEKIKSPVQRDFRLVKFIIVWLVLTSCSTVDVFSSRKFIGLKSFSAVLEAWLDQALESAILVVVIQFIVENNHRLYYFYIFHFSIKLTLLLYNITVKVGPPAHNYEHEAGSYGDGFT